MHVPDGFFNAATSVGAGGVAAGGVAVALRRAGRDLEDRQVPLAGLVAAFIFAVQMVNFPVAGGTSGHLIGGTLAAVLVGPWAALLILAVVLGVQALFADGGLTALGINITLMGVVAGLGGYLCFAALRRLVAGTRSGLVVAAAVAAGFSLVLAATAFTALYALGGAGQVDLRAVLAAMVGVHLLIGIGEGVITGLTVSAVVSVRPDLVYGARHLGPAFPLEVSEVGA